MSLDPKGLLANVHPDLVKVVELAWNNSHATQDFEVIQGLRTVAQEHEAVATGHSTTMHSRHLPDANYGGKACAIDVAALTDGEVDWNPLLYTAIADAMKAAANELDIPIEWGGDWVSFKDLGHFQLPWAQYP